MSSARFAGSATVRACTRSCRPARTSPDGSVAAQALGLRVPCPICTGAVWSHQVHDQKLGYKTRGAPGQYLDRERNQKTIACAKLGHAMKKFHHRPRKSLSFRTPYEVFVNAKTSFTVSLQTMNPPKGGLYEN